MLLRGWYVVTVCGKDDGVTGLLLGVADKTCGIKERQVDMSIISCFCFMHKLLTFLSATKYKLLTEFQRSSRKRYQTPQILRISWHFGYSSDLSSIFF